MSDRTLLVAALTADDRLDDITRARIWSSVEDRIASRAPRARRWPYAAGVLAVAAAALLAVWMRRPAESEVAAGATLTTHVGPYTRAAIVGPARWKLVDAGEVTRVRVTHGTFMAEFDGGPGRALRVEAPHMQVEVVGTLFAVEVLPASTCVSVAHGRVRATVDTRITFVNGGERLCTGDSAPATIAPTMQHALEMHASVLAQLDASAPAPAAAAVAAPVKVAAVAPEAVRAPAPARPAQRAPARVAVPSPATASEPTFEPTSEPISEPAPSSQPVPTPAPATEPGPTPAPAKPTPPAPLTAEQLYARADAALAKRDLAAADRALAQIATITPAPALAGQAIFDRARIAYQRHDWNAARAHLAKLDAVVDSSLRESGEYLTCRIAVESQDRAATSCLTAFRKAYPQSAHDRDSLGALTGLAYAAGGCAAAKGDVAELVSRYPHSALAAAWRTKCAEGM